MDPDSEIRFDSFSDYHAALDSLLSTAKKELCVFDSDLKTPNLESPQRARILSDFLLALPGNRLRIVLHDTRYVENHCPLIMLLLTRFNHCFEIRRTPDDLRHLTECFALADKTHGVVRFHVDHGRGKTFLERPDVAQGWWGRFEELWACSQSGLSPTRLGL